jgi:hypothetical protein
MRIGFFLALRFYRRVHKVYIIHGVIKTQRTQSWINTKLCVLCVFYKILRIKNFVFSVVKKTSKIAKPNQHKTLRSLR